MPLSKATVDAIRLYRNRSPPPRDDGLIRYNVALGKGKSAKWLSGNPGTVDMNSENLVLSLRRPKKPGGNVIRDLLSLVVGERRR